jgi:hypothetical protein
MLFSQSSNAQLLLRYHAGYGLPSGTREVGTSQELNGDRKIVKGSFGAGLNGGVSLGFRPNDNIGFYLDGTYSDSRKYEEYSYFKIGTANTIKSTTQSHGRMLSIAPMMEVRMAKAGMRPYTRFGFLAALCNVVRTTSQENIEGNMALQGKFVQKLSGNFCLGFQGALGLDFNLGTDYYFFIEGFGRTASYGPNKKSNTENYTGLKLEDDRPQVKELKGGDVTSDIRPYIPFSSFGLNIGMRFEFGKGD